jgi:hypothetical protein
MDKLLDTVIKVSRVIQGQPRPSARPSARNGNNSYRKHRPLMKNVRHLPADAFYIGIDSFCKFTC